MLAGLRTFLPQRKVICGMWRRLKVPQKWLPSRDSISDLRKIWPFEKYLTLIIQNLEYSSFFLLPTNLPIWGHKNSILFSFYTFWIAPPKGRFLYPPLFQSRWFSTRLPSTYWSFFSPLCRFSRPIKTSGCKPNVGNQLVGFILRPNIDIHLDFRSPFKTGDGQYYNIDPFCSFLKYS